MRVVCVLADRTERAQATRGRRGPAGQSGRSACAPSLHGLSSGVRSGQVTAIRAGPARCRRLGTSGGARRLPKSVPRPRVAGGRAHAQGRGLHPGFTPPLGPSHGVRLNVSTDCAGCARLSASSSPDPFRNPGGPAAPRALSAKLSSTRAIRGDELQVRWKLRLFARRSQEAAITDRYRSQ